VSRPGGQGKGDRDGLCGEPSGATAKVLRSVCAVKPHSSGVVVPPRRPGPRQWPSPAGGETPREQSRSSSSGLDDLTSDGRGKATSKIATARPRGNVTVRRARRERGL
jgi:hypothetical protein